MSEHYVCTGKCEGVSDKPMSCGAQDCEKTNQPLTACNCTDSEHKEVKEEQK